MVSVPNFSRSQERVDLRLQEVILLIATIRAQDNDNILWYARIPEGNLTHAYVEIYPVVGKWAFR